MTLAAAFLVCLVSLSGAFTLWIHPQRLRQFLPFLVSLAVGVLLGDAFLHLIPEAAAKLESVSTTCLFVLLGMLLFFVIEKILRGHHAHDAADTALTESTQPGTRMILVGDAIHNFTDGILIAGSYAVDPLLGFATSAAIILHEIPQELGDVGALIHGGYTPHRALVLNFCCSLTVIAGVLATLAFGYSATGLLPYLLPIAAGGFIYIAAADFMPSLHRHGGLGHGLLQTLVVAVGICFMAALKAL